MLAKQEMFQKMLGDLMNNSSLNSETLKILKEINKMVDETENELINKNITPEILKRQDRIITRLLEAENSEYQREIDKKRKSNEATDKIYDFFDNNLEYNKINTNFNELLNTTNIKMYKYYQNKYSEYLINLKENK